MSATNRGGKRIANDVYSTPSWCVDRLLERVWFPYTTWFEPAAGDGAIIKAVDASPETDGFGINWTACEIRSECRGPLETLGADTIIGNFLDSEMEWDRRYDVIITNPPFSLAMEFIEQSLELTPWLVMLLRTEFFGTSGRAKLFRSNCPDIYVLPNRPMFGLNKHGKRGSDSSEYGWFIWTPERDRKSGRIEMLAETPAEDRRLPVAG